MYYLILCAIYVFEDSIESSSYTLLCISVYIYIFIRIFSLALSSRFFVKKITWDIASLKNASFVLLWDFLCCLLLAYILSNILEVYSKLTINIIFTVLYIIIWIAESILIQPYILKEIPEFINIRTNKIKLFVMVLVNRVIMFVLPLVLSLVLFGLIFILM